MIFSNIIVLIYLIILNNILNICNIDFLNEFEVKFGMQKRSICTYKSDGCCSKRI